LSLKQKEAIQIGWRASEQRIVVDIPPLLLSVAVEYLESYGQEQIQKEPRLEYISASDERIKDWYPPNQTKILPSPPNNGML
jgi:hypothetical protein